MNSLVYRPLSAAELTVLCQNANTADDWSEVFVAEGFRPDRVSRCHFMGKVCIGALDDGCVSVKELRLPSGLYNSVFDTCVLGSHSSFHNVHILSHYHVGSHCLLFNIDEMTADDDYAWMEPMNECGGRRILPFNGMRVGDAFLWARYRDRSVLMHRLQQFTEGRLATAEGSYGVVGDYAVIKNMRRIHNVAVNSDAVAPTLISDSIVLSDGVVGFGSTIADGCIARRFLLGENVHLEFGARINDSVVGDNSTIARCEVGCSIIFPAHEQHHNNSFLIAGLVMGQSNVAAGCTIGSNHNGRTADNEIAAGRGFWPGLCSSFKHPSRFASYCLVAKGSYPSELDISLPFALVSNNTAKDQLEIMPAYWWLYNMYALNRNEKKFAQRDKRCHKFQHVEFSPLAPDTVEEVICGRELLRHWTESAYLASAGKSSPIEVLASNMEKGRRKVVVVKAAQGYAAYEDMLYYYAVRTLLGEASPCDVQLPSASLASTYREVVWENLGGQLVPAADVDRLIDDIESGTIASWDAVHERLDFLWQQYPAAKQRHAYAVLCMLRGVKVLDETVWSECLARYNEVCGYVATQIRVSREKDEGNPFRRMMYRNDAEMNAVLS